MTILESYVIIFYHGSWAATNNYFHYQLIVFSIKCQKMMKNGCYNFLEPLVTSTNVLQPESFA